MCIKAHIHKTHRQFTNGLEVVEVNGSTVGECLNHLVRQFPGIKKEIFNENGKLRNIVEIYVNLESAYPDELAKAVKDGDEIHVTFILAGG